MSEPNEENTAVFPMSGWDIGIHEETRDILFCPHFLATMMDTPDKPQKGQTFVLTTKIARELARKLIELSGQVEIDGTPIPESKKN